MRKNQKDSPSIGVILPMRIFRRQKLEKQIIKLNERGATPRSSVGQDRSRIMFCRISSSHAKHNPLQSPLAPRGSFDRFME
jgi:hypothetical protein